MDYNLLPGVIIEGNPHIIDLSLYPGAIVTTYTQIGYVALFIGILCLIGGYIIGRKMGTTFNK